MGFAYCVDNHIEGGPIDASIQRIGYGWEPGARVGAGYNLPRDGWDLEAVWTGYFNQSSASSENLEATANNRGLITFFYGFGPYSSAAARWNLHYNMIDLDVGKKLSLSQAFSLRLFCGLRGGWIYQRFLSRADGPQDPVGLAVKFTAKDRFNGIGPLGGLEGDFKLGKGFSLNGQLSASALYGQIRTKQDARQLINGVYETRVHYIDAFFDIEPAMRCALGFAWEYCFPKSRSSLLFAAGWETNYWWDQYHIFAVAPIGDIPSFITKPVAMEGAYSRATGNF
jgi:hypothetical protein